MDKQIIVFITKELYEHSVLKKLSVHFQNVCVYREEEN